MKRFISVFVCILVFISFPFCANAYSASSLAVIEHTTRTLLESVDCDRKMPMASTTKIMTALVVLENIEIDKTVTVPAAACGVEGSSIYLTAGERMTVEELLYGLLLESGNDAAVALAIVVSGSVDSFVSLMNKRAYELGLKNTHFKNPSGLPDDDHYTTARELAVITAAAMDNACFSKIVSTQSIKLSKRVYVNHNKLLKMYDSAVGVKTGFTKKAGRCLVSAAKRENVTLICVTLNAPDDWNDHMAAYEKCFEMVQYRCIAKAGAVSINLATPDGRPCVACNKNDIYGVVVNDKTVSEKFFADNFVYAPKAKGQMVGRVSYYSDGLLIASAPLCLTDAIDIKTEKQSFLIKIFNYIKGLFK